VEDDNKIVDDYIAHCAWEKYKKKIVQEEFLAHRANKLQRRFEWNDHVDNPKAKGCFGGAEGPDFSELLGLTLTLTLCPNPNSIWKGHRKFLGSFEGEERRTR